MKPHSHFIFAVVQACSMTAGAGTVTLFTDHGEWTEFSGITQPVPSSAGGLTHTGQLFMPPEPNDLVGSQLDFVDCLPVTAAFSMTSLQPSSTFVFAETDLILAVYADALSVGPIGAFTDDDLRFDFPGTVQGGEAIFAFGFTVRDNDQAAGEAVNTYGIGDVLLDSFPLPHCPGASAFVGVVSESPIAWIHVDESDDADDMAVGDFEIGSQLPPNIHYGLPALDWEIHVGSWETFHMHAKDVGLAEELKGDPTPDAPLTSTLTYPKGAPLSRSFRLTALEKGATWVLDDAGDKGLEGTFEEALSVGEQGVYTHDVWQLEILDGPPVDAIAFLLCDSDDSDGECIEIYGVNDTLFATIAPVTPQDGGKAFISMHAHEEGEAIGRIVFHESPDGDDIAISELRLAPTKPECMADVNHDGTVDGADLGLQLAVWGLCKECHHEDMDKDGDVDGADLGLLLAAWGPCPK